MAQTVSHAGIDVSKHRLDVHIHPCGRSFAVANDPAGHAALVAELRAVEGLQGVCLEATGGYERGALEALAAAGLPVRMAAPDEVRAFAHAARLRAKTDRLDAALIARFAAAIEGRAHVARPRRGLEALVRLRRQLLDMAVRLDDQAGKLGQAAARLAATTSRHLRARIALVETRIARLVEADPELARQAALLRSVPGVGPVTAATLLARMPELGSIRAKAAAAPGSGPGQALVGVAPYDRQSGGQVGRKSIRGGRRDLRNVLYPGSGPGQAMAAIVGGRHNPDLASLRDRLRRAGKPARLVNRRHDEQTRQAAERRPRPRHAVDAGNPLTKTVARGWGCERRGGA